MKLKHSAIAAALSAAAALAASAPAAADVYALSTLDTTALSIAIAPPSGASINSFTFSATDTAKLNGGSLVGDSNTCSGKPGIPGGSTNNCGTGADATHPVLDVAPANGDATPTRTNNTFTVFGPSATEDYSNSDAVIWTAELTGNGTTHTQQITESNLGTGTSATATTTIDSVTGFTFAFSTTSPGTLDLTFTADQLMRALFNDPTAATANALASMNVSLRLQNDATGDFVEWSPNGNTATGCTATAGAFTCTENLDPFTLNTPIGASSNGTDNILDHNGNFSVTVGILGAGNFTLTLTEKTSTTLSRTALAVPEPNLLALIGLGLVGLFATGRRKRS